MNRERRDTFNGSESVMETYARLQSVARNTTWVNEFKPVEMSINNLITYSRNCLGSTCVGLL